MLVKVRCSVCKNVVDWELIVKTNPPICKLCFQSKRVRKELNKKEDK